VLRVATEEVDKFLRCSTQGTQLGVAECQKLRKNLGFKFAYNSNKAELNMMLIAIEVKRVASGLAEIAKEKEATAG
jgi:hypothetical protein